jgi:acyl-CoA synthetase (AMP-forming)/AMP-acid ligase II
VTDLHQKPSVFAAFSAVAEVHGPKPFLRAPAVATADYSPTAIEYSYAEAASRVAALRAAYQSRELAQGDRVALAFDSRLDVYLHLLALNALGVSIVPLNMSGSDQELRYVIEHSDSCLVTGIAEHVDRLKSLFAGAAGIEFLAAAELKGSAALADPVGDHSTEVALLYTSGTTGKPKGCMLSNFYFLNMGHEYNQLGGLCSIDSNDRLLTPLPPNHMNALSTSFMAMLMCGGCVIQLDRFHPRSWWQTVRDEVATVVHYLGVMPAILLTLEPQADENFSGQVKFGFGAGSDPRHQQTFEKRFGFPLIEAWAMTESGGAGMTVANLEPRHLGQRCVGKPVQNMEFRIADANTDAGGNDVPEGSAGELLVRSRGADPRRGFFSGYYKDAAATEEGWAGGWWHTGDIVRQGPDGSLFFVDRQKNVIRRSGENIAAVEVEAAVLRHHAVRNCAVTAVPDEIRGDEVFAFVVPADDVVRDDVLAREIFDHTQQFLAYFKLPGYIAFIDELPLTASQKISRAEVKNRARRTLESNAATDLRSFKKRSAS